MPTTRDGHLHVYQHLRDDGDRDMAVNGSNVIKQYRYEHPRNFWPATIERVCWVMRGNGLSNLEWANGITIQVIDKRDDVALDFMDGESIHCLDEFGLLAGVDSIREGKLWKCRWTIAKAGDPLWLLPGESLVVTIRDDLSDLDSFYAMVQGTRHLKRPDINPFP